MAFTRLGQRLGEMLQAEGAEQPHLQHADLLSLGGEVLDSLFRGLRAVAHHDDDALRVRGADVVEEVVLPADDARELVHGLLHDAGHGLVELVHRLAPGEVHVGVLRGAADRRLLGVQGARAVRGHQLVGDHCAHVVVRELLDLLHLHVGAESVEEVEEGNARFQGRRLCDQRAVHDLLGVVGAEHRPPRGCGRPSRPRGRRRWKARAWPGRARRCGTRWR